jgi:hypothetical protein
MQGAEAGGVEPGSGSQTNSAGAARVPEDKARALKSARNKGVWYAHVPNKRHTCVNSCNGRAGGDSKRCGMSAECVVIEMYTLITLAAAL